MVIQFRSLARWFVCAQIVTVQIVLALCSPSCQTSAAEQAPTAGVGSATLASMPIREVSIFKDGHAFVSHSGKVPTDPDGNVILDYLPTPILGTFWPYADDPNAKLRAVSAGKKRVTLARTALSIQDLLSANVGARVEIRENGSQYYRATIESVPTVSADEVEANSPAGSGPQLEQRGHLILLRTETGVRAIPIDRIQDVTFIDDPRAQLKYDEIRNLLKLTLDWRGKPAAPAAQVGMTYLQKGLRWIPHYKVNIDGQGQATVTLQATLLNELADLKDVTANLIIGVPSFDFKSTVDPISLREVAAELSPYFQEASQTAYAMSNSIMIQTQSARMGEYRQANDQADNNLGPQVGESGQNEDLFVFTIEHMTLAKGERMVVPVAEWAVSYRDVFKLSLPFLPPQEVRQSFNSAQQAELAKLHFAPKVQHVLRLSNQLTVPFTTAPALITSDKGVLGQGMMTYTSPGSTVDLTITAAVNVPVTLAEDEVKRTPNALTWRDQNYLQVDMKGLIKLHNHREQAIELEVSRTVMGAVDQAEADGKIRRPGTWDDSLSERPVWWQWYSWPYWWTHMNSASRIDWTTKLAPGQSLELPYKWHYYWTY